MPFSPQISFFSMSKALERNGGGAAYYEYIGALLCQSYNATSSEAVFSRFVFLIDIWPGTDCLQ
jgi:hypothetical protein